MKSRYWLSFLFAAFSLGGFAQQKIVEHAIVKAKAEITFPENANRNAGGGDDSPFAAGGMETKSTIYFTKDFTKTFTESDFGNNTVIIDKKNERTTTLTQANGRKTGFYSTAEDEAEMRRRMDSIRQARGQSGGNRDSSSRNIEIMNTDQTKKIAGYTCKKAIIKTKTRQGENETTVWYTPDFKMAEGYPTAMGAGFGRGGGGGRQRGGAGFNMNGLDKIDGFVMEYEVSRPNGFSMHMEVTSVNLDPALDDKTFEIPKGYDIKPIKEMQGQFFGAGNANRNAENN
ncbi:MAG TPA: DUF4412 domain-containing protein [Agriterribacter sp.]|nr:DUF4412 domain-containing protein [Agriterribacter sp.]